MSGDEVDEATQGGSTQLVKRFRNSQTFGKTIQCN